VVYAAECEHHTGKHVSEEYGIVEIVDDRGVPVPEGQNGFLVGTTLHNTAFPLLRFRVGDVSALMPGECTCGRSARRIADVTTKAEDLVVTPDGRLVSPSVLTHPFKPIHHLRMSQIIQERIDLLRVKLVPGGEFGPADEAKLVAALQERVGAGMRIEVEIVTEISRERSGKFRWVISRVRPPDTPSWD
jgi:phenylacetate-CoA ligase